MKHSQYARTPLPQLREAVIKSEDYRWHGGGEYGIIPCCPSSIEAKGCQMKQGYFGFRSTKKRFFFFFYVIFLCGV